MQSLLAQAHDGYAFLVMAAVIGYFLGSIPFGILLTRLAGGPDLRTIGSGNIGATNVLRTGRKGLAAATLLGDALKGTAGVLIVSRWGEGAMLLAALGAFFGHTYSIWLRFTGGKGVATYLGCLLGIDWRIGLAFIIIWILSALISRYSSLSALLASGISPIGLWITGQQPAAETFLLMTAVLWFRHRDNITRLMTGQEGKIGTKNVVPAGGPNASD